jgi:hypothetical protein
MGNGTEGAHVPALETAIRMEDTLHRRFRGRRKAKVRVRLHDCGVVEGRAGDGGLAKRHRGRVLEAVAAGLAVAQVDGGT